MIEAGIAEPEVLAGAEPRLRVRAELSMTLLHGIVETGESDRSGLEKAMDCPTVAELFPAMAFLSSSTLVASLVLHFPSSEA